MLKNIFTKMFKNNIMFKFDYGFYNFINNDINAYHFE